MQSDELGEPVDEGEFVPDDATGEGVCVDDGSGVGADDAFEGEPTTGDADDDDDIGVVTGATVGGVTLVGVAEEGEFPLVGVALLDAVGMVEEGEFPLVGLAPGAGIGEGEVPLVGVVPDDTGTTEGELPFFVGVAEDVGTTEGESPLVGVAENVGAIEGESPLVEVAIDGDTNEGEFDIVGVSVAEGELPSNGVAPVGDDAEVDGEFSFSGVAVVSGEDDVDDGEFSVGDDDGTSLFAGVSVGFKREGTTDGEFAFDGVSSTMGEGAVDGGTGIGALIDGELVFGVALELTANGDETGVSPHVHTHLQSHVALL